MGKQENQHLLDLPRIIAVGIASPAGAALTSRFGVTGTLVGLALSAVIIAVVSDLLKVYLQRLPGAVTTIAGRSRTREAGRRSAGRSRSLFSKLASLPPAQRRSTLIRWVVGIGLAFIIGLGVVTTVEASVGKNLSCWLWHNCPTTTSSSSEGEASNTSTLPSILGGGSSASTTASQASTSNPTTKPVAPSPPPSSTPAASPTSPSSPPPPPASSSGSETPSTSSPPSSSSYQQEGSSSTSESKQGTSEEEGYKQSSSETSGDHQQQQQQQQSKYRQSTDKPGGQHQQAQ